MDPEVDRAREEAAQWLAKLERGLRGTEGASLREWAREPANRAAIVDIARSWHGPEVLAILAEIFPINRPMAVRTSRGSAASLIAVAASTVVVVLAAWMLSEQGLRPSWAGSGSAAADLNPRSYLRVTKARYTTAVGERREIELPDKSLMKLNTNTSVVVTYSARERDVWLAQGEATFEVVHEEERPFFVHADHRYGFLAVGTQFDVRVLTPEIVQLIVTEGTVKLFDQPLEHPETPALARLRANMTDEDTFIEALQRVQLEPGLQFPRKLAADEANDLLAWQHDRIIFRGQPLENALAEMSRYTNARFVLSDGYLRTIPVIGDFRTGDIDGFLRSLRRDYHIDSQPESNGRISLRSLQVD